MPFDLPGSAIGLPTETSAERRNRSLVALWLFGLCGMILVMVVLGGATRLTGSGLSIMEWAPLSGILPPRSEAEWQRLFALYQQIPQYHLQHAGFDLDGFRRIFWLEWIHRLWGRLIGAALLLPLVGFATTGMLPRGLWPRLAGLFVLGGLQGAVGWFMVASGWFPDATAVSPYRLTIHLGLALALYAALLWTGLGVLHPAAPRLAGPRPRAARALAITATALIALTILAGGLTAGLHAGFDYNSFPLMDGHLVPPGYGRLQPFLRNLTENIAAVQFDHRLLATASATTALLAAWFGLGGVGLRRARLALLALGLIAIGQYALGVATLLSVVQLAPALAHQIGAVLLLTAGLVSLHALRGAARPHHMPVPERPATRST